MTLPLQNVEERLSLSFTRPGFDNRGILFILPGAA